MIEKFDFDIYNKTHNGSEEYTLPNGNTVYLMDFDKNGGFQYERLPSPSFYTVYKEFYANGNIKKKETFIGSHVKVRTSYYYDRDGGLVKQVDEDQKFGKIKPLQVLEFLQEKGYIDLKTGKGRVDEDGMQVFWLDFNIMERKKIWTIGIVKGRSNDGPANFPDIGEPSAYIPICYYMDGETGKISETSPLQECREMGI
ncbi:hypothetical protein [Stenoxybacter acetivorans]|uniref:hypothetical protein n=1 Tax=Stenoxybacter acetivorans TaxID=422441 RepID=UPI001B8061D8|nr:hypothetical protein [Stenoxybacter acetivorans]